MKLNDVQHIFFDLDNTLWDHRANSEATLSEMFSHYQVQEKYGVDFDTWHQVFYAQNEVLWQQLSRAEISKDELRARRFSEPFSHFGIEDRALATAFDEQYLALMLEKNAVVPGAEEILKYLKPKYKLHVITNGFIEVSQGKVERSVLNGYFESLTCADEIGVRKPSPILFDLALEKAGAQKENSLLVGDDWEADILGSLNYGIRCVYFNPLRENNSLPEVPTIYSLLGLKEIL
uniref:YjjG family noncanonical pyrimidine nucleotidase n=1 Tax=Ornithobacterium rhinotracheale TaxID=28251 RepID=UPI0039A6CB2E